MIDWGYVSPNHAAIWQYYPDILGVHRTGAESNRPRSIAPLVVDAFAGNEIKPGRLLPTATLVLFYFVKHIPPSKADKPYNNQDKQCFEYTKAFLIPHALIMHP